MRKVEIVLIVIGVVAICAAVSVLVEPILGLIVGGVTLGAWLFT